MTPAPTESENDHGRVVRARRFRVSFAWLFPVLAAAATAWLFWSHWKERGPEIEITFPSAPGIQAGKTSLFYRGVAAGKVTAVALDPSLDGVVVKVRLQAFAAELARAGTDFWIDQPEISLRETTGLDAIIQGNSIQARLGGGPPATRFQGLGEPPLSPLEQPPLVFWLEAADAMAVDRGTPVLHHGVPVGEVIAKKLAPEGRVRMRVAVDAEHAATVLDTSRFWMVPGLALQLGARGATLAVPNLTGLLDGGIAFDSFAPGGGPIANDAVLPLAATEAAARADGPTITLTFDVGDGLVAGETRVSCLGQPVGLVKAVTVNPESSEVVVRAQLDAAFASLARAGSTFTLVRPRVSLQGVSGLETLLTGPFIACKPGASAEPATAFVGRTVSDEEWSTAAAEREGLQVVLTAPELPTLGRGAPVYHRGIPVGSVLEKFLDREGRPSLRVVVRAESRAALRTNSRFWRVPATSVSAGPGVVDVRVTGLLGLLQGGIAFDNFTAPGGAAQPAQEFVLFDNESLAAATSPPVRISLADGRGLLPGRTQLRYLGVPVGVVEAVTAGAGRVVATARFREGFDSLRRIGAAFTLIKPEISLQGVSGLETLLSGVYLDCEPGTGPGFSESFTARVVADPTLVERRGFSIRVTTDRTAIRPGALVVYRETRVGEVVAKSLTPDGSGVVLDLLIDESQRHLVRGNSVFWDASGIDVTLGFIKAKIQTPLLIAAEGRVAFTNPRGEAPPAAAGTTFPLARKPPR